MSTVNVNSQIVIDVNIQCKKAYRIKNQKSTSSMPYFIRLGLVILCLINEYHIYNNKNYLRPIES